MAGTIKLVCHVASGRANTGVAQRIILFAPNGRTRAQMRKERESMESKTKTMIAGAVISILLLLFFGLLQEKGAKFLSLSSQWIFIAIMPILVALFVGGYITKFKGFGVELESALKETVSTSIELKASEAIADILGDEKQSMAYLRDMSIPKALSIRWLVFELGRKNYYSPQSIKTYLTKLSNIDFLDIRTKKGQFVCYLPKKYFKKEDAAIQDGLFDMDKIRQFIVSLENEEIEEKYAGIAISVAVKSTDNLMQVLKTLRDENVNMAAVTSEQGRYLGVLFSNDVERKIADAILKSQSS